MKTKVRGRLWSVFRVFNFKLIWVDELKKINESCIIQWENIIYIMEAEIKGLGLLYFISDNSWRNSQIIEEIDQREENN